MHAFLHSCCLIVCISLCGRTSLTGQSYLPMAVENATWIVAYGYEDYTYWDYFAYKVQGDSLYEGKAYKKVYFWELEDNISDPYQIEYSNLSALLRDDPVEGKVYAVIFNHYGDLESCISFPSAEVLLYNFGLEAGDTINDCRTESLTYGMIIQEVDTTFLYTSERRIWSIGNGFSLIEGVGNSKGLFSDASDFVHASYGPHLDDYCIGTNFECGLHTATNNILADQTIVYPNPVTDKLHWKTDVPFESAVIYTSTGQVVEQHTCAGSPSIDLSRLPSGLYFLELQETNRSLMTRFLKQ